MTDSDRPRKSLVSVTEDGNLEFDLSKSSDPPPGKKVERLATRIKSWGTLLAAIGAFAAALQSLYKPTDTTASKAAYEAVAKDVRTLSEQMARMHDDMVAQRAYMDGTLHTLGWAREAPAPVPSLSLGAAAASSLTPGRAAPAPAAPAWRPAGPRAIKLPPTVTKVPDPPALSEAPERVAPRSFEAVVQEAKAKEEQAVQAAPPPSR